MDPALICGHTFAARALGQNGFRGSSRHSDRGSKRVHFGVPLNPAHHLVGRIECYLGLVRTRWVR